MWSIAPDGGCVGTVGRGPAGPRGSSRESRGDVLSAGRTTPQTSGAIPWYGRDEGQVHLGRAPTRAPAACHHRRVMPSPPPSTGLPLAADGYPAAGGVARRPAGPRESA